MEDDIRVIDSFNVKFLNKIQIVLYNTYYNYITYLLNIFFSPNLENYVFY